VSKDSTPGNLTGRLGQVLPRGQRHQGSTTLVHTLAREPAALILLNETPAPSFLGTTYARATTRRTLRPVPLQPMINDDGFCRQARRERLYNPPPIILGPCWLPPTFRARPSSRSLNGVPPALLRVDPFSVTPPIGCLRSCRPPRRTPRWTPSVRDLNAVGEMGLQGPDGRPTDSERCCNGLSGHRVPDPLRQRTISRPGGIPRLIAAHACGNTGLTYTQVMAHLTDKAAGGWC
jgi:hypothetical protein